MMDLIWNLGLIFILSMTVIFIWFHQRYKYWKNKKVRGPKPTWFVGNLKDMIIKKLHMGTHFKNIYDATKDEPYVGIYLLHRPALLVNNLDLIKMILVKDFIHFTDHGFYFNKKTQPLANHLFNMNGARWKGVRTKLTPAFTSSKMKYMFDTIAVCGEELTKYLEVFALTGDTVDIKDAVAKFSTDVIVSCAFGIDSNSFKYPDAEFRKMGKRVFDFDLRRSLVMFMTFFTPELQKYVDGKILDKCVTDFFTEAVARTVKYREENNVTRNDLLQLLIRLKNNENIDDLSEITDIKENEVLDVQLSMLEMTAQAFGFYGAGFETSSTATSFIFYQLALHKDIQEKVIKEIDEALAKNNNEVTYEVINNMTYIGQVIDETLRLCPPIPALFRICTKEYVIPHTNVVIDKGTPILIPTLGIHKDPNIYPDPDKFDPERFSPENKSSRNHYSFLTFGEGPRLCIGNRFAQLQIRIAMISVLRYYEVSLAADKIDSLKVANNSFLMTPTNMNLKLTKRQI